MPAASVPADAVRVQLDRLLFSTGLRYSERLSRFLKFVVEQALAGHADQLKESVLAIEIFDRHSTYDSHVDSVVRVEARRLREKLDKYYKAEGLNDPVVIGLPKGSYVPEFRAGTKVALKPSRRPPRFRVRAIGLSIAVCVLAAVVLTRWIVSRGTRPPATIERLTSDPGLSFQPAVSADGRLLAYSSDRAGSGALDIWVRQVPRGAPVRVTDDPADELEPAFSPDGTMIAYRQEGERGGIYVVPALGGKSTLMAREGYRPRFSPDGALLAFWIGERSFRTAKVFVMPPQGGNPRQVHPEFSYAGYPVWSPDGRYLVFVGGKEMMTGQPAVDRWDWWVAPVDGGKAIQTAARAAFEGRGLRAPETAWTHRWIVPYAWTSSGHILFSARSGDQTNIWRISLSLRDGHVSQPEQLTFGAGRQDNPGSAADGSLVFTALTQKSDIWSLPIHPQTLDAAGPAVRLTSGPADCNRPAVARNGKRLAFVSGGAGADQIWVKDLGTKREAALTATPEEKDAVVISPDGSQVSYGYSPPQHQAIFALPFEGGKATRLCADCGLPRAWLPGGGGLLFQRITPAQSVIGVVDLSGHTGTVVQSSGSTLFSPSVSADGRWMVLIRRKPPNDHRVMVVPLAGGAPATEDGWIPVSEPGSWVDKPRWAATGNAVYYVSDRDGFVCIWVRRLDPATKQPVGEPKAVAHFHSGRISLGAVYALDLSVAEDKLVFNLGEASGNIWLAPTGR